ncbi:MAG: BrnT family toxin [Gammaproteobacteria bacterium]|nr:BrnT family toxin [Gammaproteobacteria bacterium]
MIYDWDSDKNNLLIDQRGVSFEEVVAVLEAEGILDIIDHPNKKNYGHQKIYIVEINGYIYLIPFVEDEGRIFLKTIIPNRKANKKYLSSRYSKRGDHDE